MTLSVWWSSIKLPLVDSILFFVCSLNKCLSRFFRLMYSLSQYSHLCLCFGECDFSLWFFRLVYRENVLSHSSQHNLEVSLCIFNICLFRFELSWVVYVQNKQRLMFDWCTFLCLVKSFFDLVSKSHKSHLYTWQTFLWL